MSRTRATATSSVDKPETVTIDGVTLGLGWIPGDTKPLMMAPPLAIDTRNWAPFEISGQPTRVKNQNGYSACNGHATASSMELAEWLGPGTGSTATPLSAWWVYSILCGGIDRGSNISDALALIQKQGICLETLVPYGTIQPRKLSDAAKADALKRTALQAIPLTTWDDIVNAAMLRRPGNVSIRFGNGSGNLDARGVPPVYRGNGNHATAFGWGAKPDGSSDWLIKIQNSHSEQFGNLGGYYWMSRAHWEDQNYQEAWALECTAISPEYQPPVAA